MAKGILLYNVGESVELFLLIKSAVRGVASNGKPFLSIAFQDKSGDIEAKLWDASEEDVQSYRAQQIVKISGDIQSYRGKNQLRIKQIRLTNSNDQVILIIFLKRLQFLAQRKCLIKTPTQYIFEMKNPNIQRITRHLVKKNLKEFLEYPAAMKNHHEFVSGLAYHVVSMLDLAKAIAGLYPSLDKDLLYEAVALFFMI